METTKKTCPLTTRPCKGDACAWWCEFARACAVPLLVVEKNDEAAETAMKDALCAQAEIVHCRDCKHLYPKDFWMHCPHRVGMCKPDGFCERGERRMEV